MNKPDDIPNFLVGKPKHMLEQLNEIIETLRKHGLGRNMQSLETVLLLWLKAMLEKFESSQGQYIDIDKFSDEQKSELLKEIDALILKLQRMGIIAKSDEIIALLVKVIFQSFNKVKKLKEQEVDFEFLTEKDKKRIRDELFRMAIYEMYKIMNPKRIAGETRLENFINNIFVGGLSYARTYDKTLKLEDYGISKNFLDHLEAKHQEYQADKDNMQKYYNQAPKSDGPSR